MNPSKAQLSTAQRIYDRLGRGSVADIDAIAQALAEAESGGMKRAAQIADARLILYPTVGQKNAIRECVSSILSEAES